MCGAIESGPLQCKRGLCHGCCPGNSRMHVPRASPVLGRVRVLCAKSLFLTCGVTPMHVLRDGLFKNAIYEYLVGTCMVNE